MEIKYINKLNNNWKRHHHQFPLITNKIKNIREFLSLCHEIKSDGYQIKIDEADFKNDVLFNRKNYKAMFLITSSNYFHHCLCSATFHRNILYEIMWEDLIRFNGIL